MMSLLLVEFCSQTSKILGIFGHFVGFSRGALSDSFVMVESVGRVFSWDDGMGVGRIVEPHLFPCSFVCRSMYSF